MTNKTFSVEYHSTCIKTRFYIAKQHYMRVLVPQMFNATDI